MLGRASVPRLPNDYPSDIAPSLCPSAPGAVLGATVCILNRIRGGATPPPPRTVTVVVVFFVRVPPRAAAHVRDGDVDDQRRAHASLHRPQPSPRHERLDDAPHEHELRQAQERVPVERVPGREEEVVVSEQEVVLRGGRRGELYHGRVRGVRGFGIRAATARVLLIHVLLVFEEDSRGARDAGAEAHDRVRVQHAALVRAEGGEERLELLDRGRVLEELSDVRPAGAVGIEAQRVEPPLPQRLPRAALGVAEGGDAREPDREVGVLDRARVRVERGGGVVDAERPEGGAEEREREGEQEAGRATARVADEPRVAEQREHHERRAEHRRPDRPPERAPRGTGGGARRAGRAHEPRDPGEARGESGRGRPDPSSSASATLSFRRPVRTTMIDPSLTPRKRSSRAAPLPLLRPVSRARLDVRERTPERPRVPRARPASRARSGGSFPSRVPDDAPKPPPLPRARSRRFLPVAT